MKSFLVLLAGVAIACGGKAVAPIDNCTDVNVTGHIVAPPAPDSGTVINYTCTLPKLPIVNGRAECHIYEVLPVAAPVGCDASVGQVKPDDATLAKLQKNPPGQLDPTTHPVCELQQIPAGQGWACAPGAVGWCAPPLDDGNPQHCRLAFTAGSDIPVGADFLLACGSGC